MSQVYSPTKETSAVLAHYPQRKQLEHIAFSNIDPRGEVLARIEYYVQLVVAAIARQDWPLSLPIHGTDQVVTWRLQKQRRKCLLLFYLLTKVHALLRTNTTSNKRYIYDLYNL